MLTDLLGNFGGNLDEPGRRNAQRDWVHLRLGAKSADRYVPEVSRDSSPSDQASLATLENNSMRNGEEVMVGSDQWHWSHIPVHARLLQEIVQVVAAPEDNGGGGGAIDASTAERTVQNLQQVGQDPRQLLQVLVACSKHVQEHLAAGGQQIGMKDQAKKVTAMLRDLRPTIKALNLAVATQERVEQAQREKQEREMQELQARADENELRKAQIEADKKAEVEMYKADRNHEVAMRKLELERQVAGAKSARDDRMADADAARGDMEAAARVEREERIARARINASNAVNRMNAVQQGTGMGQTMPVDIAPPDEADYFAGM